MWQSVIAIKPEKSWKFTPEVIGSYFRLRHINPPQIPIGWIAQAEVIPNTDFHQVFAPQRMNGLVQFEVIELVKPRVFATRKLAIRQDIKVSNDWIVEVEVYTLLVQDLNPDQPAVNPTISTTKNVTSVTMNGTTSVKLLAVNASGARKNATFYNPSTLRNLYIDTDSTINTASAIAKVAPGKLYISDIPSWQGEYWGMFDGAGTTAIPVEEYV